MRGIIISSQSARLEAAGGSADVVAEAHGAVDPDGVADTLNPRTQQKCTSLGIPADHPYCHDTRDTSLEKW